MDVFRLSGCGAIRNRTVRRCLSGEFPSFLDIYIETPWCTIWMNQPLRNENTW